jgi:WD40 repeat protein
MFSSQEAEFVLNTPCKALTSLQANKVESRFAVGTCLTLESNHVQLLRVDAELNEIVADAVLDHPTGPVSRICSGPKDEALLLTLTEEGTAATLWRIPFDVLERRGTTSSTYSDGLEHPSASSLLSATSMDEVATFSHEEASIVDIAWRSVWDEDAAEPGELLTLDRQGRLKQWDISLGEAQNVRSISGNPNSIATFPPQMAWDPHNSDAVAITSGVSVKIIDLRADTHLSTGSVESFKCHRYGVTDLDYNPNKPYAIVTGGQDGLVKFWDLRSSKHPLLVAQGGHGHWVTRVKYNPFHDQLVVSTGTDAVTNLWRVSTISSAPLLMSLDDAEGDNNSETSTPNARIAHYEHIDSVYDTAWGSADAWLYVSVGYDGKVVLHHVSSEEKYKILL